jgi:hypothetical protein
MSPYDQRVRYGAPAVAQQRWSATVSCTDLSESTRDASIRTPYLCGTGGRDGRPYACGSVGNSRTIVSSSSPPEPGETGVVGAEVPMSCERLYSIPFTLANSRSSMIAISCAGKRTVVVLFFGFRCSTPREYVIPLTSSTRQSGALFHPRETSAASAIGREPGTSER